MAVVTGYKFMVINLKCMSVYNVIEHAILHVFFVVDIQKKMSLSQRKEKKKNSRLTAHHWNKGWKSRLCQPFYFNVI